MNENRNINFTNYYNNQQLQEQLPIMSSYDFLLFRNKDYMHYTALSFYGQQFTYHEMHEKIDWYARALYSIGIRQGDKVALCMLNTPEGVFSLYAISKLGAVAIGLSPLNNTYKMRQDILLSNPKMVIFHSPLQETILDACKNENNMLLLFVPLDTPIPTPDPSRGENLLALVDKHKEDDVKYGTYAPQAITDILFTGGSTGVHKGVDLTASGLNCVVRALDFVLTLRPGMVHLGNVPMFHMAFGRVLLHYALCKNLEFALTLDALPDHFYNEIIRTKSNGAMGGPVHWETIFNNKDVKDGSLNCLHQLISGGEYFKPERRKAVEALLKKAGCTAGIGAGIGETEMWAPTHVYVSGKNTPDTMGYPIPFVCAKVVDPVLFKTLENGKCGLLFVKGPGMMLGYHNNPEETDKVFVYEADGTKWYNTGDLVIQYDNHEFRYIGRKKRNFVCGVDNVYPEQIESLLLRIDGILEAAVTKVRDSEKQYLPKYHLHLKSEAVDKKRIEFEVHKTIGETLGKSALPGYIVYYNGFLLCTDNGKIDFNRLEQMDKEE